MDNHQNDADAFTRFMQIVTGSMLRTELDPVKVRISELEREVRALERARKRVARRKLKLADQGKTAR